MYGDAYSGYAPWAAAKKLPKALKAIATSASVVPGINFPMDRQHLSKFGLRLVVADGRCRSSDEPDAAEAPEWRALNEKWYRSGKRYRDLGRIYGRHNPVFIRWLNHPSYDATGKIFCPIGSSLPISTFRSHHDRLLRGKRAGRLIFFTQHHRFDPHANHTLLIGPYDESMVQAGASAEFSWL